MTLDEEIALLKAENTVLREQVVALAAEVHELRNRLAQDSHNSSKPPSSDGLARKTRSLRRRSGKKPGGQIGHAGETLHLVAEPDEVIEHRPLVCSACRRSLADEPVVACERRQVQDLPVLRVRVREHRVVHVQYPSCQTITAGEAPAEAPSRAQYGPRVRALGGIWSSSSCSPTGECVSCSPISWAPRFRWER